MNIKYFALALAVMACVTYLIRLLPLIFIRKRINTVAARNEVGVHQLVAVAVIDGKEAGA